MMEGEVHSSFMLLFTGLDNDQTKEEQKCANPYKD